MKRFVFLHSLYVVLLTATGLASMAHAQQQEDEKLTVKDLAYGVSLFNFYQNQHLQAITELDVGEYKNALTNQPEDAEFLKGGLYFHYGLTRDAERIFNELLEKKTTRDTQNQVWFSLARIEYDRGHDDLAADLLGRIEGVLPTRFEDQKHYLLANRLIRDNQLGDAAKSSELISDNSIWKAYTRFNLGIALRENWNTSRQWLTRLEKMALLAPDDEEMQSLADRAQLALGLYAMEQRDTSSGLNYMAKIRQDGPLSNRALLATGWGWSRLNAPDKALAHWMTLRDKNQSDAASLEALLAIPQGYEQKGNLELSALFYDQAADRIDRLLEEIDAVIDSIHKGDLILALRANWLTSKNVAGGKAASLPRSPATPFLHRFMAQADFQTAMRRYFELLDIRATLEQWQNDLPALDLMLRERRAAFDNKRPQVQQFSGFEQLEQLRKRRDTLAGEVQRIERDQDVQALANETESDYLDQLADARGTIQQLSGQRDFSEEQAKLRLISGLLKWRLDTEFPARLWRLKRELIELDRVLEQTVSSAGSLQQAAGRNDQTLEEYQQRITTQNRETGQLAEKVTGLIRRQEELINRLAIEGIEARKVHAAQLRLHARFSLVRMYDQIYARREERK